MNTATMQGRGGRYGAEPRRLNHEGLCEAEDALRAEAAAAALDAEEAQDREAEEVDFVPTREWLIAGKAGFTVHNAAGEHYTYRITLGKPSERYPTPARFLALLTGPDNEADYTYLGLVGDDGTVKLTAKSRLTADARPVQVATWALRRRFAGQPLPAGYGIIGTGRCGRCGRVLTVPESCYGGFGPECIRKIQAGL